jgi:pimeloyl-ACP methyl ester carboxylesterase
MGIFDYPAIIDYILSQTNNSQLNFIGHSQGTTSLLVLLSLKPDYNDKINQAHLFAPPAFRKKLPKSLIVYNFLRFLVSITVTTKYYTLSHLYNTLKFWSLGQTKHN